MAAAIRVVQRRRMEEKGGVSVMLHDDASLTARTIRKKDLMISRLDYILTKGNIQNRFFNYSCFRQNLKSICCMTESFTRDYETFLSLREKKRPILSNLIKELKRTLRNLQQIVNADHLLCKALNKKI